VQKIGQNTFYTIVTGNYEGILGINYYIKNDEYIIVFEVTSSPVAWLQPDYNPDEDSFNKDVVQFLSTFQFN